MRITSEEWKPAGSNEAIVIVSDGQFSLAAFCHPYSGCVGHVLVKPLHLLGARITAGTPGGRLGIRRIGRGLGHEVRGILMDRRRGLLSVGAILLEADVEMPGGIVDGETVDATCSRIDLW
jgi:hypothetical protein